MTTGHCGSSDNFNKDKEKGREPLPEPPLGPASNHVFFSVTI